MSTQGGFSLVKNGLALSKANGWGTGIPFSDQGEIFVQESSVKRSIITSFWGSKCRKTPKNRANYPFIAIFKYFIVYASKIIFSRIFGFSFDFLRNKALSERVGRVTFLPKGCPA
jgi:hypothetical protein